MHLTRLLIHDFRNLGRQELSIPSEGVAVIGKNAQGKSNLLEAIYYLETFRSFRGGRDDQLVGFGAEAFHVAATLVDEGRSTSTEVAAGYQRRGKRKKVTVDRSEASRLADALGRLAAVVFSPADVGLVNEGPGARRRFLDIVLSLNRPGYLEALQRYRHVLAQRNAALKADHSAAMVQIWDEALVTDGAVVLQERRSWIDRWSKSFSRFYRDISGGQSAVMSYRPGVVTEEENAVEVVGGSTEAVAETFRSALCRSADRDRRHRSTGTGPHRDDMRLRLDRDDGDIDVRDYGSGGQRRTAALALRLTEAETIRDARGQEPLVLMDDVFAELDEGRSDRIMELIEREETGQVILTAPKDADVRIRKDTLPRWRIEDGRIQA